MNGKLTIRVNHLEQDKATGAELFKLTSRVEMLEAVLKPGASASAPGSTMHPVARLVVHRRAPSEDASVDRSRMPAFMPRG
ncbi:MAG: hypothetical protein WKG00_21790 [Polyangiaceae bacterium]